MNNSTPPPLPNPDSGITQHFGSNDPKRSIPVWVWIVIGVLAAAVIVVSCLYIFKTPDDRSRHNRRNQHERTEQQEIREEVTAEEEVEETPTQPDVWNALSDGAYRYTGSLDDTYPFYMDIVVSGGQISGDYYTSEGKIGWIKGTVTGSNFKLDVISADKAKRFFRGTVDDNGNVSGQFRSGYDGAIRSFRMSPN